MDQRPKKPNVVDLYHANNHEKIPDFVAMKKAGIICVMHKATQGTSFHDKRYHERKTAAKAAGLVWGSYHFGDRTGAIAQFHYYADFAKPEADEFVCLDYEDYRQSQMIMASCVLFVDEMTRVFGKDRCLLYGGSLLRDIRSDYKPILKKPNLWLAQYGPKQVVPSPWTSALFWQYSETCKVPGIDGASDGSITSMDETLLRALIAGKK